MNYPVRDVPAPGLLVAAVAVFHVFVSHFPRSSGCGRSTAAEKRALAVHLAQLGGDASAGLEPPPAASGGAAVFEQHCAACHGAEAAWPIAGRLRGRSARELYDLLGRLPQVREEMPPFSGTDEVERGPLPLPRRARSAGRRPRGEVTR